MIVWLQSIVFLLLYAGVFVACVVALVDALRHAPGAYPAAGKRTKGFWTALLGVATAVAFVAIPVIGIGQLGFLALGSAVAAIVYFVDVRPALGAVGRRPRGPRSTGGW